MLKKLSPREEEIIQLCVEGFTNDAIAHKLGLSVGTVNTYWLRIRMKVGGSGRTDTVVRVIKERAEKALKEANVERADLTSLLVAKDQDIVEHMAELIEKKAAEIEAAKAANEAEAEKSTASSAA